MKIEKILLLAATLYQVCGMLGMQGNTKLSDKYAFNVMAGETPEQFSQRWMHQFGSLYAGTVERSNRLVQYAAKISLLPPAEQKEWLAELASLVETLPHFEQDRLFHRIRQLSIPSLRKKKSDSFRLLEHSLD